MNKPKISLVFPVYNEEAIIEKTVRSYFDELHGKIEFEMILFEDGSTDQTKTILRQLAKEYPLRLYLSDEKMGYQEAIIRALQYPRYDWIFLVDSDYQFRAHDFWKLLPYTKDYDIILGIKMKRKDPRHRIFLSKCFNFLLRQLFHLPFRDMDTGFRLIRRRTLETGLSEIHCFRFFTAEFVVRSFLKGFKIKEVGVVHYAREVGNTNIFSWKRLPKIVVGELMAMARFYKEMRPRLKAWKSKTHLARCDQ